MSVAHLAFNDQSPHGALLRKALKQLQDGLNGLNDLFFIFDTMKDGDGSQASHFTYATSKFSFPDDATAKAAYDELNSVRSKLNTDSDVSYVNAALLQAFHKFG